MNIIISVLIFIFAFFCAYIDSATGMGYGTLMSPILLIFGFKLTSVVPVLLISQMFTSLSACIFHRKFKNAEFKIKNRNMKNGFLFAGVGSIAMIIAIFIVIDIPQFFTMMYVGIMIMSVGIILLVLKEFQVSKKKFIFISGISAFNKAISGGGFGPIITSGQILSGSKVKTAVAITAFSETILSAFGFILYLIISQTFDFQLGLIVTMSGVMAAPFGAFQVKKLTEENAKIIIGVVSIILGLLTVIKCFF
ncbi:MAG: sulfite exporter TauE/SafE family protein [Candidatus Lokiarchaeota archaeon]